MIAMKTLRKVPWAKERCTEAYPIFSLNCSNISRITTNMSLVLSLNRLFIENWGNFDPSQNIDKRIWCKDEYSAWNNENIWNNFQKSEEQNDLLNFSRWKLTWKSSLPLLPSRVLCQCHYQRHFSSKEFVKSKEFQMKWSIRKSCILF